MSSPLSPTESRKTSSTTTTKLPSTSTTTTIQERLTDRLKKLTSPKKKSPQKQQQQQPSNEKKRSPSSGFPIHLPLNGSFRKLPNSQGSKWSNECQDLVVESLHHWMETPVRYQWQSDESVPGQSGQQVLSESVKSKWSIRLK